MTDNRDGNDAGTVAADSVQKIIRRMNEGGDLSLDAMRRLSDGSLEPARGNSIARAGSSNIGHAKVQLAAIAFQRRRPRGMA